MDGCRHLQMRLIETAQYWFAGTHLTKRASLPCVVVDDHATSVRAATVRATLSDARNAGVIFARQLRITIEQAISDIELIAGMADSSELEHRVE